MQQTVGNLQAKCLCCDNYSWFCFCLKATKTSKSHEFILLQHMLSEHGPNGVTHCCKSLNATDSIFTRRGRRHFHLKHASLKPHTTLYFICSIQERQTSVASFFSRNKTFDPINPTSTGKTGFLRSYPKHCLHRTGLQSVLVNVSDRTIVNSGHADNYGCLWNLSLWILLYKK